MTPIKKISRHYDIQIGKAAKSADKPKAGKNSKSIPVYKIVGGKAKKVK